MASPNQALREWQTSICEPAGVAAEIERLAAQCAPEQLPVHLLSGVEQAARYLASELSCTGRGRLLVMCGGGGGEVLGAATVVPLEFDSQLYGMKMAKFGWILAAGNTTRRRVVKRRLVDTAVREATRFGYQHLAARVPAIEHDSVHALESAGFRSMDVQVTLAADRPPSAPPVMCRGVTISPFVSSDLPQLLDFSTEAYGESRLFVDPDLPRASTQRLYRQWVENDCQCRAHAVFVARMDGVPVGYVTCLLHDPHPGFGIAGCGDIDLIAVIPIARGRGVGLALVQTALAWFAMRTNRVIVKTQVTNYAAIALYQRAGFVLQQAFQTLHYSIPAA
jgi:GNAT superfamily N-acetyltransferase